MAVCLYMSTNHGLKKIHFCKPLTKYRRLVNKLPRSLFVRMRKQCSRLKFFWGFSWSELRGSFKKQTTYRDKETAVQTQEEDSKTSISSQHLKKDSPSCDCLLPLVSGTMLQMNVAAVLLLLLAAARCCDSVPTNHQEHDEAAEEKEHEELDEEVHQMHGMNKCRGGCPPDVDCEFSVTLPEVCCPVCMKHSKLAAITNKYEKNIYELSINVSRDLIGVIPLGSLGRPFICQAFFIWGDFSLTDFIVSFWAATSLKFIPFSKWYEGVRVSIHRALYFFIGCIFMSPS